MSLHLKKIIAEGHETPDYVLFSTGEYETPLAIFSQYELKRMVRQLAQDNPEEMKAIMAELRSAK